MNSMMLNVILKTIPRCPANEFEDSKLIIKPRAEWKNDIFNYAIIFLISFVVFILTEKIAIPYAGFFLFCGGIAGILAGFFFSLRAFLVYKHYSELFKDEDVKKLEN